MLGVGHHALLQYLIITAHKKRKSRFILSAYLIPKPTLLSASRNSSVRVTLIRKGSLVSHQLPHPLGALHRSPSIPFTQTSKAEIYRDAAQSKEENSATNTSHAVGSNRSPHRPYPTDKPCIYGSTS